MKELSTQVEIGASVKTVWSILTDLESFSEWNPFIRQAEGEVKEGRQLRIRIEPPGGKAMMFKPTVTSVEPKREFRWLGHFLLPGLFDGEHIFELSSLGEHRTRLNQRETFKGLLVPLFWSSLDTNTRAGFEAMNAALKERAEAAQG